MIGQIVRVVETAGIVMGIIYYLDYTTDGDLDLPYRNPIKMWKWNKQGRLYRFASHLPKLQGLIPRVFERVSEKVKMK